MENEEGNRRRQGEKREIELSVRTPASTEKAAGVGWMDFQPRIDNNCLNQARLSRPPRRRGVERRGGRGRGRLENEAKDKGASRSSNRAEHGVSTSPRLRDHLYSGTTSLNMARCGVAFHPLPLFSPPSLSPLPLTLPLALSSNSTRGSIITDTSTRHASFSSRYFRNGARD